MPDFIEPGLLVPIVIIVILVIVIFSAGYRKAPPDKAFIISGLRRKAKVVIGKATVKLPFFERCDVLELALMSVDVKTAQAVPEIVCRFRAEHVIGNYTFSVVVFAEYDLHAV